MNELLLRRRVASAEGIDIPWLIAHGCICWLPLSSEGDLLDRISGKSLELTGNGSMVWDGDKGMYHITIPSSRNQYVAFLDNGMNAASFSDDEFTTIVTIEKITSSNSKYGNGMISPLSSDTNTQTAISPLYSGTGRTNAWPAGIMKMAKSQNSLEYNIYYNGSLNFNGVPAEAYIPSNWSLIGSGLCVGMVRTSSNNYYGVQLYIKDIYIFNKVLTLDEIRKIQGYE